MLLLLGAGPPLGSCARVSLSGAPPAVRETVRRELGGARIARIDKETEDDGIRYVVKTAGKRDEVFYLVVAEDGRLLLRFLEDQFYLKDGGLMKEDRPYWIQTLQTPEAGDPSQPPQVLMKAIYAISEVGGNTLVFDLYGFKGNGTGLSKESAGYVRRVISTLGSHSMGGVCRVLGPDAPRDPAGRRNAVRAAAQALKGRHELVYWIDGPEADVLAAEFKRIAPLPVVAAPGADLDAVESASEARAGRPALVVGEIPKPYRPDAHFILPGKPGDFAGLEAAKAYPIERQPWTPDNSVLSQPERKEGFVSLFDGKTLNGWTSIRAGKQSFVVKDGAIHWVRRGSQAIQTRNRYGDFVLRCEYKIKKGGNNGIHLRAPRENRASKIGFEVQLLGDYGRRTSKSSTGAIYDVIAPTSNASKPAGEWNALEVTAKGPHVTVILNGRKVQDVSFDDYEALKYRLRRGFIRITDHGDYAAFRNLRIKEL